MKSTPQNDQNCEPIQLSISEAIDSGHSISNENAKHIETCNECAHFYQLWKNDSLISGIASGILTEQQDLEQSILAQITATHKPSNQRTTFARFYSIAAIIAIAATVSFITINKDLLQPEKKNNTELTNTQKEEPLIKITLEHAQLEFSLTESDIEQSLEKNYQSLSNTFTGIWRTTTSKISYATEYITESSYYISDTYLTPENNTQEESNTPQT